MLLLCTCFLFCPCFLSFFPIILSYRCFLRFAVLYLCQLTGAGISELHGRQSQQKRMDVFKSFSSKAEAAVLICTDIAARGIDFPAVDWVVQLNCPPDVDTYIHRVGRTARYHNSGKAVLFLLSSEAVFLQRLKEKKVKRSAASTLSSTFCLFIQLNPFC